jgi:hypothetical protein
LATHTDPSPKATSLGPLPTAIGWSTLSTPGSIRDTVPPKVFATHTAPAPAAIPLVPDPTGIVSTRACVAASIRDTVPAL